jgi:ferredoxin-like protein FixX
MNLLEHVQNGQHFCLKVCPRKIYKRINITVRVHKHKKLVIRCKSLRTGNIIDVNDPDKVTVIPLGVPE